MAKRKAQIAIVGGGVAGSVAASELCRLLPTASIALFDQGRGLGGRTSHRRVRADNETVVSPDEDGADLYKFDHGCQFFRADTAEFYRCVLKRWVDEGVAAEWRGRFVSTHPSADFFGVPVDKRPIYCGVGGMHALSYRPLCGLAEANKLKLHTGVRVASVERVEPGVESGVERVERKPGQPGHNRLVLRGVSGTAAYHDTPNKIADSLCEGDPSKGPVLGEFDVVLVTDASAAQAGWHRASAGLPEEFISGAAQRVMKRSRVALFTALVAFERPIEGLDWDAITFDNDKLWFAARTASKPGFEDEESSRCACFTIVSTPRYAAEEVERVPMRDPTTGAFIPQDKAYLNSDSGPAKSLLRAFSDAVLPSLELDVLPEVRFLTAQRWGSAFPTPVAVGGRDDDGVHDKTVEILGTKYDSSRRLPLVGGEDSPKDDLDDFIDGGDLGLYYAGDFCSRRPPGVEAAALSALHAAQKMAKVLS